MKNFFASKDTIKKRKRQSTEWEKYLQITYVIRDIYLEYIKYSYNSTNNPIKKQAKDLSKHFSKQDMPLANKCM